nr:hypothetical protein [Lachnospiraceae bacterium]
FQTGDNSQNNQNIFQPYTNPYMNRTEQLANHGPLQESRWQINNKNDRIMPEVHEEKTKGAQTEEQTNVKTSEKSNLLKAQPDLKVFTGDVMKKGVFTPQAKEAARHFFKQVQDWAGTFEDGGTGFYREMGVSNVLDCLYVDGMSFRTYIRDQYLHKATGNPAHQQETLRNYLALIAARGDHIITLVRPNLKGKGAEVEYKNLYVDLHNINSEAASHAAKNKEKGNQVRAELKKRIDGEMTERTGMAYRKVNGIKVDGLKRTEDAKSGISGAGEDDSEEYKSFRKNFEHYNSGMQKLGLIPGRDDINVEVAKQMKMRCEEAIKAADAYIMSGSKNKKAIKAAENAKKNLETDLKLLDRAINTKLADEGARMKLDELFDSKALEPSGRGDNNNDDDGNGDDDSNNNDDQ